MSTEWCNGSTLSRALHWRGEITHLPRAKGFSVWRCKTSCQQYFCATIFMYGGRLQYFLLFRANFIVWESRTRFFCFVGNEQRHTHYMILYACSVMPHRSLKKLGHKYMKYGYHLSFSFRQGIHFILEWSFFVTLNINKSIRSNLSIFYWTHYTHCMTFFHYRLVIFCGRHL